MSQETTNSDLEDTPSIEEVLDQTRHLAKTLESLCLTEQRLLQQCRGLNHALTKTKEKFRTIRYQQIRTLCDKKIKRPYSR